MTHWSILSVGIGAQSVNQIWSHHYRKYHWRLDNPDANPYLYVHDLPKPTSSAVPSNAVSIAPPTASATPFLASSQPNGFLPTSVLSWFITIFFILCFQSLLTIIFYKMYQNATAPEITGGLVRLPADHQIVSKASLDRLHEEVIKAQMSVRHAAGSVKGYRILAKLWENGFMAMSTDFLGYIARSARSFWGCEAEMLQFKAETEERLEEIKGEWRGKCNDLMRDLQTWRGEAEGRIKELEKELVEQRVKYEEEISTMRKKRENKSVKNRRKREEAEAAAAASAPEAPAAPEAPVGSSEASSSTS
ncbi:hypothetical protein G7Y79_00010g027990 [Physcia stellaris]|nr:hypothetical protein G7Y79_00010g027990 [Physcia stellaris]